MRRILVSLGAAAFLLVLAFLISPGGPVSLSWLPVYSPKILFIIAYLVVGSDVLLGAARGILRGRVFDELFLMSIATLGALVIGYYEEAIGVMAFYRIGEALQESAYDKSLRSIRALLALRPDVARVRRDGRWLEMAPEKAVVGDSFMVKPGERVPLDGTVIEGASFIDTSSVTGESIPKSVGPGSDILSGFIALDGSLTARATKTAENSAAARIISLVDDASKAKAKSERFVTRFARVYTPIVVGLSLCIAFLPPIAGMGSLAEWSYRALVLLVISCPCALVVSVPLAYFAGIGAAAGRGILIKGGETVDRLSKSGSIVFDKTGTLTNGRFVIWKVMPEPGWDEAGVLTLAAAAESHSRHPLAESIRKAAEERGLSIGSEDEASAIREIPGAGVCAEVGGRRICVGNDKLFEIEGIPVWKSDSKNEKDEGSTIIRIAVDGSPAAVLTAGDDPRSETREALSALKTLGVHRIAMLTGDTQESALRVARRLDIPELSAELTPEGKLEKLKDIVKETASTGRSTVFVGDGVNDAPALALADVGVAMGDGTDVAVERADVVLLSGDLSLLVDAVRRSKTTQAIAVQNIALSLGVKAAIFILGVAGIAGMWAAVFADVGVALLAIVNSLRTMRR
jgi:Cd2+/Zn2+-exporting ATPase